MARFVSGIAVLGMLASGAPAAPPQLTIHHFDVNTGDATLIITPDKHGVLIDAGDTGRGDSVVVEFLNRARDDGQFVSLDYTIVTHYDSDHLGGMDEVYRAGWYPAIAAFDRGDTLLPSFDPGKVANCAGVEPNVESLVAWGTAPTDFCPKDKPASCALMQYLVGADAGGKRQTLQPGATLSMDHGITLTCIVANATDADGNTVDVNAPRRRDDCAANELSIGVLVTYGDFRYLIAGDLTGVEDEDVVDVEKLIKDDAADIDVYHVNHHGSKTSSSIDLLEAMMPKVAIASNGGKHHHPSRTVVEDRLFSIDPAPEVYITNRNTQSGAWDAPDSRVADLDLVGSEGSIEITVWRRSYRVYLWRDGDRVKPGDRYFIKDRD